MHKRNFKFMIILIICIILTRPVNIFADVGSFESYGSGWDSDYSSSYDYDDYGSSYDDYDEYDDYDDSYSDSENSIDGFEKWLFIIIIIGVIIIKLKEDGRKTPRNIYHNNNNIKRPTVEEQENVEEKIKVVDELFNAEEFIAWVKKMFVKLQEAWSERDWSNIRCFESNELFEQHQRQLQGYIDNHQINKMERICVKNAKLSKFEQSGDKDILTVILSSKMIDYIIDDRTNEIIKGDKITERHSIYKMVFVRKTGIKTKEGSKEINTTNCPNCGAPTQITSSGKCEYCGSVITTGEFNWVLSNLEKIG